MTNREIAIRQFVGTYSFDANGDAQNPPMSIYEARDANWVYLHKIDASAA